MTIYQLYTHFIHFFVAKHWRGAAIHSPMMYGFVREYALKNKGEKLIKAIGAPVVHNVEELKAAANESIGTDSVQPKIIILREPFINRSEKIAFREWYARNHVVTVHFQGLIVIFLDKKLQKQQYLVRN